jgi:hypothetical protein
MMTAKNVWRLYRGSDLLGELHVDAAESDFPWLVGKLKPQASFADVKPLFDEEERLARPGRDFDSEAWEAVCRRIQGLVTLVDPDDQPIHEFILHVKGDRAWWRWND